MNTCTPIFKIHKTQHFDTICETLLFEIASFHEQNHFITEAYDWRNRSMQKWTFFLCMAVVALGENVKTYPTTQCKFLLILKMGVPVFIGASWMQFTELW